MQRIPLTKNHFTVVDDADYEWANRWKWQLNRNSYACRNARIDGKYKKVYLHRLINQTPTGLDTDHINRDKLDNRRANLRSSTRSQNNHNSPPSKANKSGVKGVSWDKARSRWRANMEKNGQLFSLGRFANKDDAIAARQEAESLL
jgi:hypothetical protein